MLAAADGYSYLHLVIVAGIIIFAAGLKVFVRRVGEPLPEPADLALCAGVAVYLVGLVAFRLRMTGEVGYAKLAVAVALLILFGVGGGLPAWALTAVIAVLLAVLCTVETAADRRPAPRERDVIGLEPPG